MKQSFWKTDWFAGLVISIAFLFALNSTWIQSLERVAYDFGVRASSRDPGNKIAIVDIDDASIGSLGRWPWSRAIIARMINKLANAKAKVIGYTVFLSEPQVDPGLKQIRELSTFVARSLPARDAPPTVKPAIVELSSRLQEAEQNLDTDRQLAASFEKAGNVVLAMQFNPGEIVGNPSGKLPDYVLRDTLAVKDPEGLEQAGGPLPLSTVEAVPPIETLGSRAAGIGHLVNLLDVDGALRTEPLVVRYYDKYFPSEALMIAAKSLNLGVKDIQVTLGEGVRLKNLNIRTDPYLQMQTFFYKGEQGKSVFPRFSFVDVLNDKVKPDFAGKIVLIGASAFGLGSSMATPLSSVEGPMAPVMVMAHTVASILNQNFFVTPSWATAVEMLVFLLVAAYLIAVLPRLKAATAAGVSATILIALFGTHLLLMTTKGMWLQFMGAAALLFTGHLLMTTKRYLVTERGKLKSETESAESNRQLGLSLQQSGQLDMAFERFRRLPMDDSVMELLYNLAGDFERKRQFSKANSVYALMAQFNKKFRDLEQRMTRAKALEDTVMLGGGSGHPGGTMLLADGGVQKPMLGRYEVEKELGKGAMGVVYLGKDPKINRVVAIKTMALSQEFPPDELEEVKARFFREAETAGRLTHPNIVSIYDVGEEHDLAYIAMEFLHGHDLTRYTKKENLLPVPLVMGIIYKAALALDYAHGLHVVHRDIKPANIMYNPDAKQIKLTDFGIARITDSSKTKTGMVLGTPSYMSPEQLSGKKIDGRSDLFSLGVMLYQMITGNLPFKGDSMATLMYKIANEPHQDIFKMRPELAKTKPCLQAIINKMLEKDLTKRYQTGAEIAKDLQACAKQKGN